MEPFNLQAGLAIFAGTHQGQRNFIVQLVDKGGQMKAAVLLMR
jgi:hypothetical protein